MPDHTKAAEELLRNLGLPITASTKVLAATALRRAALEGEARGQADAAAYVLRRARYARLRGRHGLDAEYVATSCMIKAKAKRLEQEAKSDA